jgi:glycosyltransferase involved in cell wall biosynthesis
MAKIAIFLQDVVAGGAERMMLNLGEAFAARGHAVELVLVRAEGEYLPLIPRSLKVIDLKLRRTGASLPALAAYLRRQQPDAMLSGLVHVNVMAVLAGKLARSGTRVVISERNTISRDVHDSPNLPVRMAHWAVPWVYPRADAIIAVSHGVARDLAAYSGIPEHRIEVVNNPVVTPKLVHRAAEPGPHPWFDDGGAPVVLAVGRLAPQKDYPTLLHAFALLRKSRDLRLLILGEGDERPALENMVAELGLSDAVAMPGYLENPYAAMSRAAAFVLTSRWEGSPNVLVEAMACGTPVLSTDCPNGPAEILEGGRHGPLVPMGNAQAVAEGIATMLDHRVPAAQLKRRAADYDSDASADGYLNILLNAA